MIRTFAFLLLALGAAACSPNYAPPDTSAGYSSERLVAVFARECVEERVSLERQIAEESRGWLCLGDDDCERDARGAYSWRPVDAKELHVSMQSDAHMLSRERGDGWHCAIRYWRRPDDAIVERLARLAEGEGLTRYEMSEAGNGPDHITWHVWRPADAEAPELRLIQLERPKPWTLLYVE
ncbi:MAG: hypothetical protein JNL81_12620 [Hyphomonadaceae bacterium]|nr:hypothetical protein [Hyphomonadaceae bacterium]